MKLNKLLNRKCEFNYQVSSICDNSKNCIENSIFVMHKNNDDYFEEAIKNGAKTIIAEDFKRIYPNINLIKVSNTYKTLGMLLKKYYRKIISKFKVIGITGTNGKTSTTYLIYNYLKQINQEVVLIGSNGIFYDDIHIETNNTTPNLSLIYQTIVKYYQSHKNNKTKYLVIECSSQGIRNNRLFGISFDVVGFTNITKDHFDYHQDQSDYIFSKALLFNQLKENSLVVINKQNCHFELLSNICPKEVISYGINGSYSYKIINKEQTTTAFKIIKEEKEYELLTPLLGSYQIENILLAFVIVEHLELNVLEFIRFIKDFSLIPGRLNRYFIKDKTIYIDYAHTEVAVLKVLDELSKQYSNIICIFGCGGSRDKTKRPIIGNIVERYCHTFIITEDNNREENFFDIVNDILQGIKKKEPSIIQNRFTAIQYALNILKEDEVLLILGKGIEKTKTSLGEFSDIEMVKEILNV